MFSQINLSSRQIQKRQMNSNEKKTNRIKRLKITDEKEMKYNFHDLPNEIYQEIFDYLCPINITRSFSGINYRLNCLIENIPMKFNFQNLNKNQYKRVFKQVIPKLTNQIIALDLNQSSKMNQICDTLIDLFNQSFCLTQFTNLRYLSFPSSNLQQLESLFLILPTMPSLRSLRLLDHDFILQNETICKLTLANHHQYSIDKINHLTHISIETSPPFKNLILLQKHFRNKISLNYLQINIRCGLFFYRDSLKYLDYDGLSHLISDINYLKINVTYGTYITAFDIIQRFPQIHYLSVKTISHAYANGYQWADLLAQMPNILKIDLNIYLDSDETDQEFQTFQTKFWLERQWLIQYRKNHLNSSQYQIIHRSIKIR